MSDIPESRLVETRNCILLIDPGPETSGVVIAVPGSRFEKIVSVAASYPNMDNHLLLKKIIAYCFGKMVIEWPEPRAQPLGKDVMETITWAARFAQVYGFDETEKITPREVRVLLTGDSKSGKPHIRQAVLDTFPPTGGGAVPQKGTKSKPGPLYGVSSHAFSALAVGLAWMEKRRLPPVSENHYGI